MPLVEFTYNNSYQSTTGMAPYEALYGRRRRTTVCWDEVGERKLLGPELVQITVDKVKVIKERMKEAQDRQKSYADNRRRPLEFQIRDMVFFKCCSMEACDSVWNQRKISTQVYRAI